VPIIEGHEFKAAGTVPPLCNPYPLSRNILAVTKPAVKLESYDPVMLIDLFSPGRFPK
jgi:hypothetical protein